ncbi:serine/threonine protein kinase [Tritrichomonas musculus]|uniref:non-specific serine/threonine protein kinase n=1 Tax=Tritrichomonas musculus TaxID=1915356 RepID=A0ABR2L9B2_9EUKA
MEKYHLIQQIGEGSFGKVYKARRKYTSRMVAIKMIGKKGQTEDDLISFRREITILNNVDHPNIMRFLEIIETDTDFCVVSELGRGDLFQIIHDNQTLPEDVLQNVSAQLVSAMSYLHDNKIIHRDIKPQNILIGSNNSLKICDFGFARALSNTTLFLRSIKGTPLYMAPELVQERPYDEKIDIWSLGVILYELYYGKAPFYTTSIYKLIQMISNDPITWPGQISDEFKDFLQVMLQKDPSHRATCKMLMKHPFIKNVKIDVLSDEMYRFKSKEFDEALVDPLSLQFCPPETNVPDFQSILLSPSNYSPSDLLEAMEQIPLDNPDSLLCSSFVNHFSDFIISNQKVTEEAFRIATSLLQSDPENYNEPLSAGINILSEGEIPSTAVSFFIELLVVPFCLNRIHLQPYECPDLRITAEKAPQLRDRLFGLLFGSDELMFANTLFFISFLLQVSPEFLEAFSGSFAAQSLPIVTSAIINNSSGAVVAASLSIISLTIQKNLNAFSSILPIQPFLDKFLKILHNVPNGIPAFSAFSAALSFCASAFGKLCQNSEFLKRCQNNSTRLNPSDYRAFIRASIVVEHSLESCLTIGSQMPQETLDITCYTAIITSPFVSFQLDDLMLDICVQRLPYLLPIHVPPTLEGVLSLPEPAVTPNLPQLLGMFGVTNCAEMICDFILCQINEPKTDYSDMIDTLCEKGIIPAICRAITENEENSIDSKSSISKSSLIDSKSSNGKKKPSSLELLLAHIVLNFAQPAKVLSDTISEILATILENESALSAEVSEIALIITGHFARLSSDYISPLIQAGVLPYAERGLKSESASIRARSSSLIGNITKHARLPQEDEEIIMPLLMKEIADDNQECQKFAAYAIGNEMYHNEMIENYISKDIRSIVELLFSNDRKTVEYGGYLIANFIRKSDTYVSEVIAAGALEKIISLISERDDLVPYLIQPLSVFCLYDEGRRMIKNREMLHYLQRYTKKGSDIVRSTAQSIIASFEM